MKRLLLCLLLSACAHPKSRDTANLTAKLGSAKEGVMSARKSSEVTAGHVAKARRISDRLDGKASVITKWINSQP